MTRRRTTTGLALLLLGGLAAARPAGAETLPWLMGSYDSAVQRARAEKKPLLIGCAVGDRAGGELERRLAQHAEVAQLARDFLCVRLDPLADETSLRWAAGRYGLRGPEGVILATPQEERIALFEGAVNPIALAAEMRAALELVRAGGHPAPPFGAPAAGGPSLALVNELAQAHRLLETRKFGQALASFQRVAAGAGATPEGRSAQQAIEAIRGEARAGLARAAALVDANQPGTARLLYAALLQEFNGLPEVTEKARLWLDEIPASEEAGAPKPTPRSVVVAEDVPERPEPPTLRPAGAAAKLTGLWEQARALEALRDYPAAIRVYRRLAAAALRDERLLAEGRKAVAQVRALEDDPAVAQRVAARAKEEPARRLLARAGAWYTAGRREQALPAYQAVGKKFSGTSAASAAEWMIRELQQTTKAKP